MKYRDTKLNDAGLMRCEIATIQEFIAAHADEEAKPQVMDCKFDPLGNEAIILDGDTWRWNVETKPNT